MTKPLKVGKIFRDPVHNDIHVEQQIILELINTREFQRLRRIKQLGTSSFIFHGAEHSRFSHSLGVYEIARRICERFNRLYPSKKAGDGLWDDSERLLVLCAALLHDIGHGPFSHTFEKVFKTNHEKLTIDIILSPTTEVNAILRKVSSDFPEKVAQVIQKKYDNPQVIQMISSQIDADRMDYLLRDAYYTGVSYGKFDLTRILSVIKPYQDGICFEYAGMHSVEDYIISRYQMYMQVYFHPVSRGMEVLIDHLLQRAKYCYENDLLQHTEHIKLLIPFLQQDWTIQDYLNLDDGVLTTCFTLFLQEEDEILKDLAKRYLNRKPFKSIESQEKERIQEELKQISQKMGFDPLYYTGINKSHDLPYDFYRLNNEKSRTPIMLMERNGNLLELSKASLLVSSLTGKEYSNERFYFVKELLMNESVQKLLKEI